jgi:hypothetical protein
MDIIDKVKKTISVDGIPVYNVYTNKSATLPRVPMSYMP